MTEFKTPVEANVTSAFFTWKGCHIIWDSELPSPRRFFISRAYAQRLRMSLNRGLRLYQRHRKRL